VCLSDQPLSFTADMQDGEVAGADRRFIDWKAAVFPMREPVRYGVIVIAFTKEPVKRDLTGLPSPWTVIAAPGCTVRPSYRNGSTPTRV
jgi:hypothetical protein